MDAIAPTALLTAAARARARPDRLFEDPFAAALAGEDGFRQLDAEPPESRDNPYLVIRTRFFDDWLARAVALSGSRQVVLVAAGMDSRAFRLSWPAGLVLFELDRSGVLEIKDARLGALGARPPCERRGVGVDLEQPDWPSRLTSAGFDARARSVWLAEGFFEYLEPGDVTQVLAAMASLAVAGSRLGADFVAQDLLTSPWMAEYLRMLERRGTAWRFGTNDPEVLLERDGWQAELVKQPGEEGAGAGRWPWPVAPREVPGLPRSFFVTAVRV